MLTIGLGLLWLMGLMAWFESHFTILALMLPTLMVAIGCSYMVHVINQIGISQRGVGSGEWGVGSRDRGVGAESGVGSGEGGVGKKEVTSPTPIPDAAPTPHSPLPTPPSALHDARNFITLPVLSSAMARICGHI